MGASLTHDFSNESRSGQSTGRGGVVAGAGVGQQPPPPTAREAIEALLTSKKAPIWTGADVASAWKAEDRMSMAARRRRYKCGSSKFLSTCDIATWDCHLQGAIADSVSGITNDLKDAYKESRRRQLCKERRDTKLLQVKKLLQSYVAPVDSSLTKQAILTHLSKLHDHDIVNRLVALKWSPQKVVDEFTSAWNGAQVIEQLGHAASEILPATWDAQSATDLTGGETNQAETTDSNLLNGKTRRNGGGGGGGAGGNGSHQGGRGSTSHGGTTSESVTRRRQASNNKVLGIISQAAGHKLTLAKNYLTRAVDFVSDVNATEKPILKITLHDAVYFLSQCGFDTLDAMRKCKAENAAAQPAVTKLSLTLHGVREYKLDMVLLRSLLRKYDNDYDNAIMAYSAAKHQRDRIIRRIRSKLGAGYASISESELIQILYARNWDADQALADILGTDAADEQNAAQKQKNKSKSKKKDADCNGGMEATGSTHDGEDADKGRKTKETRQMKARNAIAAAIAAATAKATSAIDTTEKKVMMTAEGIPIDLNVIDTSIDIISALTGETDFPLDGGDSLEGDSSDSDCDGDGRDDDDDGEGEGDNDKVEGTQSIRYSSHSDLGISKHEEDFDTRIRRENKRIARDVRERDTPLVSPDSPIEPNTEINKLISLWEGDACRLEMDAIVIPATPSLVLPAVPHGTRVKGIGFMSENTIKVSQTALLHEAAGTSLLAETAALETPIAAGGIHITRGYNLPAKFILHTVPPPRENRSLLEHCVTAALDTAREKKLKTIVICPLVTAGSSEYPFYSATHATIYAIRRWLDITPNRRSIDRIIISTFHPFETKAYRRICSYYFPGAGQNTFTLLQRFQVMFNQCDPKHDSAFQSDLNRMSEEQCESRPPLDVYGQEAYVPKSIMALGGGSGAGVASK